MVSRDHVPSYRVRIRLQQRSEWCRDSLRLNTSLAPGVMLTKPLDVCKTHLSATP